MRPVTSPRSAAKDSAVIPARSDSAGRRRRKMYSWMQAQAGSIRGGELANRFRVSRQCVVQDIAILRAGGYEIMATPSGYRVPSPGVKAHRAVLACSHPPERTQEELHILVDNGVKVVDVIVEHAVYGELRGSLSLESRADVEEFLRQVRASKAGLLSSLTGGVHLHTVEASRPEKIARAKAELRGRGFLLK